MSDDATLDEFVEIQDSKRNDSEESGIKSDESHPRFGKLPPEWSINEIADIAEVVGGSTPSTDNDDYWGGGIPWATPTDITALSGNTISETADTITEEGLESASTHLLPPYSVLMTSRASIGKCAVNTVEMATNQGFKNLVPEKKIETWYLYYRMLETANFLNSVGSGSTFDEVSKTEVQSVDIPIPPLPEQRKIATVLYTVDRAIEKTKKIVEQQERLKQALLQDLFERGVKKDGELRDKHSKEPDLFENKQGRVVHSGWEVEKLANLGEWVSGKTPKRSEGSYWGGNIPWISAKDMKTMYVSETEDSITDTAVEDGATMVSKNSVLVLVRGMTLAHTLPVVRPTREVSFNQDVKAIIPQDSVDSDYLAYWLKAHSNEVLALVTAASHGTKRLATDAFRNLSVPVPPINEQNRIVERISSIDSLIETEKDNIARLDRVKKGLQQDLLSGTVRTTDTKIEVPDEITQHG